MTGKVVDADDEVEDNNTDDSFDLMLSVSWWLLDD